MEFGYRNFERYSKMASAGPMYNGNLCIVYDFVILGVLKIWYYFIVKNLFQEKKEKWKTIPHTVDMKLIVILFYLFFVHVKFLLPIFNSKTLSLARNLINISHWRQGCCVYPMFVWNIFNLFLFISFLYYFLIYFAYDW